MGWASRGVAEISLPVPGERWREGGKKGGNRRKEGEKGEGGIGGREGGREEGEGGIVM